MRYFPATPEEMTSIETMRSMSGLEFMRGILEGRLAGAPIAKTLGFDLIEVEEGRVVFEAMAKFEAYNPIGSVHGGWFGTLLDSCMGCAVQTKLPAGSGYTTLEYKVNILRAANVNSGMIRAEGNVTHAGRRTATAEGKMIGLDGKLYATATTTCLIFPI